MAVADSPFFSGADFRSKIRYVWQMARPELTSESVTWHFNPAVTTTGTVDGDDVPFDPAATQSKVTPPTVRIECGVEYIDHADEPTPFGPVVPGVLKLTVFDEDVASIKDSTYVVVNGNKYKRSHVLPPYALFAVTLHEYVYEAVDVA